MDCSAFVYFQGGFSISCTSLALQNCSGAYKSYFSWCQTDKIPVGKLAHVCQGGRHIGFPFWWDSLRIFLYLFPFNKVANDTKYILKYCRKNVGVILKKSLDLDLCGSYFRVIPSPCGSIRRV